jgi:phage terminase small subunit
MEINRDEIPAGHQARVRKTGMLKNFRHEAFAQAIARGSSASAAFVEAGFKANRGNAARLRATERVTKRIVELQSLTQKLKKLSSHGVVLTQAWVIEQLIGVILDARSLDRPDGASANKGLHLLGLELGMFTERAELGRPGEFDGLTVAAKRDRMLGIASQLGISLVGHAGRLQAIDQKDITPSSISPKPPAGGEPE